MIQKNKYKSQKQYDAKRALAVKATSQNFKVSESYVRQCLNGTKDYGKADEIKKFYTEKYNKLKQVLN